MTRRLRVTAWFAVAALVPATLAACASTPPATGPSAAGPSLHLVSNGGHRLAFHVTPGHQPVIVLDAGGGMDSSYWKDLVPVLAERTGSEIVTYDRAGLGASDEVPGPWKVDDAVADLAAGLTALGATHDVVLVSHSEAGEIATYVVRDHPHWVRDAVLVDASLPDFYTDSEIARIVAANKDQIAALASQPPTRQNQQLLSIAQEYAPMHHAYHQISWPRDIPAIVIASGKTPFEDSPQDARLWRDAQASFAHAAPNRRLVVAAGTSHDIPLDRPDVVVTAVRDAIGTSG